ncbi:hypothetical protein CsSME_00016317 [Camellia sinensis var. sinensis]
MQEGRPLPELVSTLFFSNQYTDIRGSTLCSLFPLILEAFVFDAIGVEKRCLNFELWRACAGPLLSPPAIGSRVVYFPQGHSEQHMLSIGLLCYDCYTWQLHVNMPIYLTTQAYLHNSSVSFTM